MLQDPSGVRVMTPLARGGGDLAITPHDPLFLWNIFLFVFLNDRSEDQRRPTDATRAPPRYEGSTPSTP
ncbi:unnamed protein product, partial [Brenthis ino]